LKKMNRGRKRSEAFQLRIFLDLLLRPRVQAVSKSRKPLSHSPSTAQSTRETKEDHTPNTKLTRSGSENLVSSRKCRMWIYCRYLSQFLSLQECPELLERMLPTPKKTREGTIKMHWTSITAWVQESENPKSSSKQSINQASLRA
jgi:hypothetical protein